jgi:hypothetical protein
MLPADAFVTDSDHKRSLRPLRKPHAVPTLLARGLDGALRMACSEEEPWQGESEARKFNPSRAKHDQKSIRKR